MVSPLFRLSWEHEKATLEVASINGDRRIVALTGLLNPVHSAGRVARGDSTGTTPATPRAIAPDAGTKPVRQHRGANRLRLPPITSPKQAAPKQTPPPPPPTPAPKSTPPAPPTRPRSDAAAATTSAGLTHRRRPHNPNATTPATPATYRPRRPRLPVIGASLTPNPVQFPPVTVGALSVRDVMITNTGDAPFPAGQATIQGDHWNDFRIVNDPCSTHAITSPCTIRVVFLPSEAGQHRAQLLLPGRR